MVVAMVEIRSYPVAVQQGAHMVEALASKRGWDGSSS